MGNKVAWAIGAVVVIGVIACGASCSNTNSNNGISQGLGSQDATKDVSVTTCKSEPDGLGGTEPKVVLSIVNHSSKRSDYFIEVQLVGFDGSRVGDGNDLVTGLNPDQSSIETVADATANSKEFTCRIQTVQRTASG
jgi:hypothetical protein